jgi:hypothetical protein
MSDSVPDICPVIHNISEIHSMPKKSDAQREIDDTVQAYREYTARKKAQRDAPLNALQQSQRLERSGRIEIARQHGLPARAARAAVDLFHRQQYLKLEQTIRDAEHKRLSAYLQEQENAVRSHPVPWSPDPPILARARDDHRSLEHWAHEAGTKRSDEEFVAWLESSRLPPLRRPIGVPGFEELDTLEAVKERIEQIHGGDDRQLRRRLRNVVFPLKPGRPKAQANPQQERAIALR